MKSVTVTRPSLQILGVDDGQSISRNLQMKGDLFLEDKKYFEALECYNKSLCVAQNNSDDISSAYACRSIVYLQTKDYQLCLENIELARKYCDSVDKLQILEGRKKVCQTMIAHSQSNEIWKYFRLSYESHEKTPFIVNCLQLHSNKKFGRFIITTQG